MASKASAQIGEQKSTWQRMKENVEAYLYILPAILVVLAVSAVPLIYGIYIAFTNMNLYHLISPFEAAAKIPENKRDVYKFIGLDNFVNVFTEMDARFPRVLLRTLIWTVINIVFHVFIGVALALLLNRKTINNVFRKVMRSLLILPWAVPNLVTLMVWKAMYNKEFGFINLVLSKLGINGPDWIGAYGGPYPLDAWIPFMACVIANIWLGFPFMMMVASGGLQSISEDIYEAGDIDGASGAQKLWYLTIPLLKPTMVPSIILGTIWTFTNFNAVYLITEGGPIGGTEVISTFTFNALKGLEYARASTYAIITSIILIIVTILNLKLNKALEEEAVA